MVIFCPKCGEKNGEGAKFCKKCGTIAWKSVSPTGHRIPEANYRRGSISVEDAETQNWNRIHTL